MSLKFAANLNFLFTEGSPNIVEKIKLAAKAGFRAVEIPYPGEYKNQVIKTIDECAEGVKVTLINIACTEQNKFGCASIPGAEDEFKRNLAETIDFAKAVKCNKIHLMAGTTTTTDNEAHLETYKNNLKYAVSCLEKENLIGVIEPINKYALPLYFMNCYQTAASVLDELNSKNLKLMLDIFHLQHIRGNVSNTFKELGHHIGHIQIAQVPHRHEPDVIGELDFNYVFQLIKDEAKYADWIGCEYKPKNGTIEGLKWLPKFGCEL